MSIRCPWCGSPVTVRGSRWECGWCGDCGDLSSLPGARRAAAGRSSGERAAQIDRALIPLEQGTFAILEGLRTYCGGEEGAREPLWKLTAYGISRGLRSAGGLEPDRLGLLRAFFAKYPVLDTEKLLAAAQGGTEVFAPEFALSMERLGSFWQALLPQIPADGSVPVLPDWLCRILEGLCEVEEFFCAGDGAPSSEVYEEVLAHHWKEYFHVYFSPEETVRCWDLARNENALCELLLHRFPHVFSPQEQQLIQDGLTDALLEAVRRRDPALALRLWRTLLDAAQEHLKEPEAAEVLLDESVEPYMWDDDFLRAVLEQLGADERFARQLFLHSAYTGPVQEVLLDACVRWGNTGLRDHLESLLRQNPQARGSG